MGFAKQHCSWKQLPTFTFRNNHKVWFEFVRRTTKDAYAFPSTFDWFITQPKKVINGIFSKFSLKTGAPKEEMVLFDRKPHPMQHFRKFVASKPEAVHQVYDKPDSLDAKPDNGPNLAV